MKNFSIKNLLKNTFQKKNILNIILCTVLSLIFAILYITMGQFRDSNSLSVLMASKGLLLLSAVKAIVFTAVLSFLLSVISVFLKDSSLPAAKKVSKPGILFAITFVYFLIIYLPWLLMNYPGSTNPDGELQLRMYLGLTDMSNWQPVLSTYIIGFCYSIGKSLVNANFGFFLYELLQTVIASLIFSYTVYRLRKNRLPLPFCIVLIMYFSLFPIYGGYAQWVEKDFLFAVFFLLQTVLLTELIVKKECDIKDMILLSVVSVLVAFLRNNGIYAVAPALLALLFFMKKKSRVFMTAVLVFVLVTFIFFTKIIYPGTGILPSSVSETIGFMFQQTARYVNSYPDEVTEYEKEVLTQNFQDYDNLKNYNPVINDPVKIYYNHTAPKEYFEIWFKMFFKHPNAYVASYLNGAYGYLAPVDADTGSYIMTAYDSFLTDELGIYHTISEKSQQILIEILNSSSRKPVIKILAMPGLYTWLLCIMILLLLLNKKRGETIAFIPSIMTVLVCTVSPLACAMRYALPFVMCTPVLLAWVYTLFMKKSSVTEE